MPIWWRPITCSGPIPPPITAAAASAPRANAYHDPFVLFGFLAGCTRQIGFAAGVLILAQRQAVLVAKQAASLDVLCGGRFRLGIGVGWNEVEFVGLNENFRNRGRRSEEQVQVMQALWAEPHVSFAGEYHRIEDAGINPRPASGRVPIWFGGHAEATFRRAAKYGDGFMPLRYPPGDEALAAFEKLRRLTREAGRDPARSGWRCGYPPAPAAKRTGGGRSRSGRMPGSPTSRRTRPMSASTTSASTAAAPPITLRRSPGIATRLPTCCSRP